MRYIEFMHYPVEFFPLDAVIGLLKVNIYLVYIYIEFPTVYQDLRNSVIHVVSEAVLEESA
jgi:hypothetical protein